jgi:hypothetical protein
MVAFVLAVAVVVFATIVLLVTRVERNRHTPASRIEHTRNWRRSSGPQ